MRRKRILGYGSLGCDAERTDRHARGRGVEAIAHGRSGALLRAQPEVPAGSRRIHQRASVRTDTSPTLTGRYGMSRHSSRGVDRWSPGRTRTRQLHGRCWGQEVLDGDVPACRIPYCLESGLATRDAVQGEGEGPWPGRARRGASGGHGRMGAPFGALLCFLVRHGCDTFFPSPGRQTLASGVRRFRCGSRRVHEPRRRSTDH